MLNDDGTRDEIFKIGKMEGGLANFACLLDNDNIVVSGAFTKYDGVTRRGFLILGRDGKALQQFNVPGIFQGELYKVIETRTSTNSNGLLLLGDFSRFDSPDKILAYAGMSPSTYQSGQLDNCYSHMEKRGSRYLRYALFIMQPNTSVTGMNPLGLILKRNEPKANITMLLYPMPQRNW